MNKSTGGGSWNRKGKSTSKELAGMRRQRSLEWRNERDYSSSDDEIARPVDSQIFASLLAQAQKEFKDDDLPLYPAWRISVEISWVLGCDAFIVHEIL
ncbi:hypothetical protein GWI33_004956 [Rhynchophorus ferrugineus]|uniref:Uncharacterized protein n=1 Tax=Rhynchophorus ferrugineus TaxID=354439 RepID=A0A834J2P9_RHYFE|nr:hypothetical protein GWI33_004956 [Rhynchophorus ferrugineus]